MFKNQTDDGWEVKLETQLTEEHPSQNQSSSTNGIRVLTHQKLIDNVCISVFF